MKLCLFSISPDVRTQDAVLRICVLMLPKTTTTLTYFPFFHFDEESSAYSNCTESQLALCESQFNENSLPVCLEVIELKTCLAACENIKEWSSWNVYTKYEALVRKMNSYPDCIPESKGRYVIFFVCYGVFKHNIGLSFVYCNMD